MHKIYTRVGDQGRTKQISGKMVPKYDLQIAALGNVDELRSWLGVAIANLSLPCQKLKAPLIKLQRQLYLLQTDTVLGREEFKSADIAALEQEIDRWAAQVLPMTEFILPGGKATGAYLQYARTLARKAERAMVQLNDQEQAIHPLDLKFLNRLSDYLFMMARYANYLDGYRDLPSKEH